VFATNQTSIGFHPSPYVLLIIIVVPTVPASLSGIPWTYGMSGAVYFISEQAVVKCAMSDDTSQAQLSIERQIYNRLGLHPCITALLGFQ
jgi:hypothetical protein